MKISIIKLLILFLLAPRLLWGAVLYDDDLDDYDDKSAAASEGGWLGLDNIRTGGVTAMVDQILVDGSSFSEVCE
jgi:hypothetical protein